jgi:two-component system sensor histidine kinase BaeS
MSPDGLRSSRFWYQSLYWRIALGLFAFLALMLIAEAALFLWTSDRIAGSMPARSPRRLAVIVASDISAALSANPNQDLQQYVTAQFGDIFQTFVVVMRDGRTAANHDDVPQRLQQAVVEERQRLAQFSRDDDDWGDGRGGPDGPRGLGRGRSLPPERPWESAVIRVDRRPAGIVSVLAGPPPFSRVVRAMGPTTAVVGGGVLVVGTALIALFVFGPARRRLKEVQQATERLGAGDLGARAPERGGDEVSAVARSFNRMADELATRAQALEESDRARRQLLADVSHELLTPLTAMRGYLDTLAMPEVALDESTRERYLAIVNDETLRLEHIVGDLLDLARLEGGGTTLNTRRVEVSALFERVRARHQRAAEEHGVRLVAEIQKGAEVVEADPDRLEQALQNLAANALRHTPAGGEIRLESVGAGDRIHLRVRDTGPGIPDEHLPLIFDRFYKVDTARKAAGGSGLGLSIVKAIVERHGGSIEARNDRGAVFDITLPTTQVTRVSS